MNATEHRRQDNMYWRMLGYVRPYWRQVVIAYASMALATLINLLVPQIIRACLKIM